MGPRVLLLIAALWLIGATRPSCALGVRQVGIIGGGVGGTSCAYFLKSLLGEHVNITLFDRNLELGGRTSSWEGEGGQVFELGASIAWTGNQYVRFLAGEVGLSLRDLSGSDGLMAIFDGSQLVFRQSSWDLLTLVRLWWRYGLSFLQIRGKPEEMFQRFSALYPLQDSGQAFERPEAFLKALGLYDLTQQSLLEYIRDQFGQTMELFASEVIAGVNRVNYNQGNLQLNALAGLVSLLPATNPSVFSIQGGNQQLAQRLAAKAGANVLAGVAVGTVALRNDSRFDIWPFANSNGCGGGGAAGGVLLPGTKAAEDGRGLHQGGGPAVSQQERRRLQSQTEVPQQQQQRQGQQGESACGAAAAAPPFNGKLPYPPFDAVIMATPLENSGIAFEGLDLPALHKRTYQTTVTTLVEGALQPAYFGQASMPYTAIMVTEDAPTPFSSLAQVGRNPATGAPIFKLFSQEPLAEGVLAEIFAQGYRVLKTKGWEAYPRFDPPEDFAPFKLAPGLFYSNALENSASAMEIAAIAGRNSALLAAQYLASLEAEQQ